MIQADGLCGGCNGAVYKKYEKGTAEYEVALAAAKARFTNPDYGRGHRKRLVNKTVAASSQTTISKKRNKKTNLKHYEQSERLHARLKVIEKATPRNSADPLIIPLIAERNALQKRVFKLNKAIEALQS